MGKALLVLVALAASPLRADDVVRVCARQPIDRLPAGTALGVSEPFLAKAREQVGGSREPSAYETELFPVFFDRRITWLDGSQLGVTCTVKATLHQLELRRFSLGKLVCARLHSPVDGSDWMKYVWELDDGEIRWPASLICEVAPARVDSFHPYAPFERTRLEIGLFEDLMFEFLPLRIRTETGPPVCP